MCVSERVSEREYECVCVWCVCERVRELESE